MTRFVILTICVVLGLAGCSSSPDRPDDGASTGATPQTSPDAGDSTSPMSAAEAWLASNETAEFATLLGESPVIERVWSDSERYRALAAPATAGSGLGEGVLLTLVLQDGAWQVTEAEAVPASVLWPGI